MIDVSLVDAKNLVNSMVDDYTSGVYQPATKKKPINSIHPETSIFSMVYLGDERNIWDQDGGASYERARVTIC